MYSSVKLTWGTQLGIYSTNEVFVLITYKRGNYLHCACRKHCWSIWWKFSFAWTSAALAVSWFVLVHIPHPWSSRNRRSINTIFSDELYITNFHMLSIFTYSWTGYSWTQGPTTRNHTAHIISFHFLIGFTHCVKCSGTEWRAVTILKGLSKKLKVQTR